MQNKLLNIQDAIKWRNELKSKGAKLVFTNGVFDILHSGHVQYLAEARSKGQELILGLNSDVSVKKLNKGPDRPYNSENDRALVLAGLESVSRIVFFDAETPLDLIKALLPDILAKGQDYKVEQVAGAAEVISAGGCVELIKLRAGRSTTSIVERIRATSATDSKALASD
jgi:rfaE bifunctional protein nucleotidyltransferase chain/domain